MLSRHCQPVLENVVEQYKFKH